MDTRLRSILVLSLITLMLIGMTGCIAGTGRYSNESRANFWVGLFHGFISPITLFVSLFTDAIGMYEPYNVGWGYDCGFFLGIAIILGGGCTQHRTVGRLAWHKKAARRWDRLGDEIAREIEQAFKGRSETRDEGGVDESWQEVGRKIEEKIKRSLKEWAEKD